MDRATDQLDRLIQNRATTKEKANAEEESWKASARAFNAEHQEARRYQWVAYHRMLARNHAALAEANERRAAALTERKNNE
jgi:hypothetical protein